MQEQHQTPEGFVATYAESDSAESRALWFKLGGFAALTLLFVVLGFVTPVRTLWRGTAGVELLQRLGIWAPLVLILIGTVAPLALLPRWPIAVICGLLYGTWLGGLLANLASTFGAWLQFYLARGALRPAARRMLMRHKVSFQNLPPEKLGPLIIALRTFPLSNFAVTNLLAAALNVPLRTYLGSSFIGMLPASFLYGSWGYIAREQQRGNIVWLLMLLTVVVLAWLTRRWLRESLATAAVKNEIDND